MARTEADGVHDGIRHLEKRGYVPVLQRKVHDGIRHLEKRMRHPSLSVFRS
ncbi:hypothetical protein ACI8B_180210 [Acinetobacter proteolyticus]|uniref:Uncharacterized protein n=1 Tax=Acinetobacter proteolyticus TaxID=1776741 RepID=A0A653K251_9GAMM|nr:hypothetical protein ACI8B_180210 [Acinetobacter proteolyticus]